MYRLFLCLLAGLTMTLAPRPVAAQEKVQLKEKTLVQEKPGEAGQPAAGDAGKARTREQLEADLAEYLSGARFVGKFTIDGKNDAAPKTEEYVISKCEKLPEKNMYRMTARIKYGDVDSEVPLDLKILWSGTTPVITLDSFWIPGMGTFGARVLIHRGRYAGTWQHDEVGGHMFGKIKK